LSFAYHRFPDEKMDTSREVLDDNASTRERLRRVLNFAKKIKDARIPRLLKHIQPKEIQNLKIRTLYN